MNSQIAGLRVAGTIFALVCLGQLLRLLLGLDVAVASHHVPLWPSAFAFLAAGALSLWMWKLSFPPRR